MTVPFSHGPQWHRTNENLSGGHVSFHCCYFWISPTWTCTLILMEMVKVHKIALCCTDESQMVIRAGNWIRAALPHCAVILV